MSKDKTLKEIALELLEKYRLSEESGIYYSEFIHEDLANLKTECDEIRKQIEKAAEPLAEEDYTELLDRFGEYVEFVVRDMITGKGERWRR